MAGAREDLDTLLCETIGSEYVYFQPPENLQIQYPCIIYSLNGFFDRHASNKTYHRRREYSLLYITSDPDDANIEAIGNLELCSLGKPYTAENLHHYPYTIYY